MVMVVVMVRVRVRVRVSVRVRVRKNVEKTLGLGLGLENTSKKRCLTVGQQSRDLRPLSRDRSATFFKNFPICLKRRKNVV